MSREIPVLTQVDPQGFSSVQTSTHHLMSSAFDGSQLCDAVVVWCVLFLPLSSGRKCHSLDPALQLWRVSLHCIGQCRAWSPGGDQLQVLDSSEPLHKKRFWFCRKAYCKNLTFSAPIFNVYLLILKLTSQCLYFHIFCYKLFKDKVSKEMLCRQRYPA